MKSRILLLALAFSLASCVPALGQLLPAYWTLARVTRVVDGDTYEVLLNSQKKRVRLLNADCPEVSQPFGPQATDSVKRLLFIGRLVLIHATSTDLYGRTLAHVKLPRAAPLLALSLDSLLVVRGWAWATGPGGSPFSGPRTQLQASASGAHRGLWKCASPASPVVPPKIWRGFNAANKRLYRGTCTW